ncbi:hypothetical protein [uncultured Stenotrophomonas sp.]|uniref:hypothetical protein n=1 Tax=uncultured Stenotrophomonas sp. TaxID=165438 RepID=UPI0028E4DD2A|nr:hypothetical protein [uncultured Stenotrophomonas sp.]
MSNLRFVPALALLLAACSAPSGQAVSTAAPETAAAPKAAVAATPLPTQQEEKGMHKECPGARLHLTALPAQDGQATQTRLEIEKDGQRRTIDAPAEMRGYTAVGLACVEDQQGTSYFVVQYGELPYGCAFCEWFYLYDANGKQLTHSNPPVRGEGESQSPNNDEYSQLIAKLGIKHPEVDDIED